MEQSERACRRARRASAVVGVQDSVAVTDLHAVEARSQAPVDVLDRDQRTVRVAVRDSGRTTASCRNGGSRPRRVARPPTKCCDQCQVCSDVCEVCDYHRSSVRVQRQPQCRIYHSSSSLKRRSSSRSSSSWFPVGSVIRWFLAVVCVLALLSPRAMAAPTPTRPQPKWVNPCGLNKEQVVGEQELEYQGESAASVSDLIQRIVTLSKHALDHAVQFRVQYVEETFQKNYEEHHDMWKNYRYQEWLPAIPKEFGKNVTTEYLQKQKLDVSLKDIYKYLQMYAVGLEQVVWDQKANRGRYLHAFDHQEHLLRNVLCEVQVAMAEQGVVQHPDVSPDIMTERYRKPNAESYRNVRDWIILREYMNGLEYVIQLLEHFSQQ